MRRSRVETKTGDKINHWTILNFDKSLKNNHFYFCQCVCGTIRSLQISALRSGKPQSCGCKRGDHRHTANGGKKSLTYSCWSNMVARCTQPSNPAFLHYQSRGIAMCDQWKDFNIFFRDMGERPSAKHTLDRIDNEGGYEPGNVRWATKQEQANNRKTNIWFEYMGTNYTLANLARFTGVNKEMLRSRLCRSKRVPAWTVEEAVKTPK